MGNKKIICCLPYSNQTKVKYGIIVNILKIHHLTSRFMMQLTLSCPAHPHGLYVELSEGEV
jgi:uncharacterized protein YwbE